MVSTFKLKPWVYAGLLALSPLSVNAAGLGKLTVTSALGQPLRAEIELVAVEKNELDTLSAHIASAEAYRDAQIDRNSAVLGIKFSVEQKKDGKPIIKLSTLQPVNEPFLDMLVELNWAAGRLLREYTVLLDPPGYAEPQSVQPVSVPTVKPTSALTPEESAPQEPAPAPSAKIEPPMASKADKRAAKSVERKPDADQPPPAESQPDQAAEAKNYGPVKKGDTLTGIASQLKPQGFSLDQMLVALYQSNKQAFAGNNMNRLKSGQILRIPDEQQLASTGNSEAAHEVKTHTADWNAYRQKLAATVAETPAPKEEAPKQLAKGKITSAVEDKAAPAPAPSKDVLKVTKGEAPANGKELQSLQGKLQSLQEETTAKGKSLKDANDRIASLEKSIKDMQQLIELKNKNLADLQKQAAAKPEPVPAIKPETPPPPKPEAAPQKPAEPVAEKLPEAPKPAEQKPVEVKPKPAPAKVIAPPPAPPEASLLDSITGSPLNLAAGAGILALLGGGAMIAINRRRRKSLSSFEDSILTGGDLKANTVFGETAGGVVDTGDTSFLTDFSQAGLGTIDTNDVDPIAEAEVYMAYGRDAQAEEILKEAMAKDPSRHEVHLKLLEIYASRKNLIAFETLAGELYASIGGKPGTIWNKAADMGRALDPNNPLYSPQEGSARPESEIAAPVAATTAVDLSEPTQGLMEAELTAEDMSADMDFDVDQVFPASAPEAEDIIEEIPPPAPVVEEAAEDTAAALEFDLDTFAEKPIEMPRAPEAVPAEEEQGLEFDLDELMPHLAPAAEEPAPAPPPQAASVEIQPEEPAQVPVTEAAMDLDFSLELPAASADESIVIESTPVAEQETHLDFDFDLESEMAPSATEEKAQTPMPELDLSGISLDLEQPAPSAMAATSGESEGGLAEVATKLDLARAYVEMGDKDGAKEILEEVLKEGSAQQQADANQLLASI